MNDEPVFEPGLPFEEIDRRLQAIQKKLAEAKAAKQFYRSLGGKDPEGEMEDDDDEPDEEPDEGPDEEPAPPTDGPSTDLTFTLSPEAFARLRSYADEMEVGLGRRPSDAEVLIELMRRYQSSEARREQDDGPASREAGDAAG